MIIAGIGLTSSSIVQNILNELLKLEYDIQILGEFDSLVGIVLIAFGLTHNILLQREKTKIEVNGKFDGELAEQASKREHDAKLFNKITEKFEEYYLTEYITSLKDDHSYLASEKNRLRNLVYFADETEYDFINEKVNNSFIEFGNSLSKVMEWCAIHFFHYPANMVMEDQRYCLYPELNPDRGGHDDKNDKYDEHARYLDDLTDDLLDKYKLFRTTVKRELYI